MTIQSSSKISKNLFTIVKLLVLVVIFYFIYTRLSHSDYIFNWDVLLSKVISFNGALMIIGLLGLQFLNYYLEMRKWKHVLQITTDISSVKNSELYKAVYCGTAIGFITPDRLGTFVGRFIYLKELSKTKITTSTFFGNYIQLFVTVFFGLLGFLFLFQSPINQVGFIENSFLYKLILIAALVFLCFILLSLNRIVKYLKKSKFKFIQNIAFQLYFLEKLELRTIFVTLSWGIFRYIVFVLQFALLFMLFEVSISIFDIFIYVSVLFIFTTTIPSPLFGNLGTREAVSLLLLSSITDNYTIIIISLSIWFLNVVFPALIGYWYLRTVSFSMASMKNNYLNK